ncbi:MAG: glycosyltransferase [Patescibacteria group bacterium]
MFNILFFGTFVPVQGTKHMVEAAKLLEHEEVRFLFAGDGQEQSQAVALAKQLDLRNVVFCGMLDRERLREEIAKADVVLGNVGDTPLSPLVISNKVFEALAMGKAVVTADMPANRELFGDEDVLMVPVANPEALAAAILKLKNDPVLRERVASRGHKKFLHTATPSVLGNELKQIIQELL